MPMFQCSWTRRFTTVRRTARGVSYFGRTHVVKPKGKHQATVVWLHGLGDNGSGWSQILETLPLSNIKWICPTAPTQPHVVKKQLELEDVEILAAPDLADIFKGVYRVGT